MQTNTDTLKKHLTLSEKIDAKVAIITGVVDIIGRNIQRLKQQSANRPYLTDGEKAELDLLSQLSDYMHTEITKINLLL